MRHHNITSGVNSEIKGGDDQSKRSTFVLCIFREAAALMWCGPVERKLGVKLTAITKWRKCSTISLQSSETARKPSGPLNTLNNPRIIFNR